jgi:hypothetical protein
VTGPAGWSRALWAAAEPFTLGVLMSREARHGVTALGVARGDALFALRGAPLGRASGAVAAAAFHGFPTAEIVPGWERIWAAVDPGAVVQLQHETVAVTVARTLDGVADRGAVLRFADLLGPVVARLDAAGRPLAAANQALPVPDEPWARFWRACTTLREYRGDGHVAALVAADLDVVEAQALTVAWAGDRVDAGMLRSSRKLDDEAWAAAQDRLAIRGLLTSGGALTDRGRALRDDVEDRTDRAALRPWLALGEADRHELLTLLTRVSGALLAAGHMVAVTAVGAPWPPPGPPAPQP